jgi:hypothetical protein
MNLQITQEVKSKLKKYSCSYELKGKTKGPIYFSIVGLFFSGLYFLKVYVGYELCDMHMHYIPPILRASMHLSVPEMKSKEA